MSNNRSESQAKWVKQYLGLMQSGYVSHLVLEDASRYPQPILIQEGRRGCQEAKICDVSPPKKHGGLTNRILHLHSRAKFIQSFSLVDLFRCSNLLLPTL